VDARQERLQQARLYLVCDARPDDFLHAALRGGVDIVQLRMKSAADQDIVQTARRFARLCADQGVLFILNDRPELVKDARADGVHVGQGDVSVTEAREILGAERLIGLSTHAPDQIEAANAGWVDYIGVGPVYATPTKPGRPAVGLGLVGYASARARQPFFAIGGINGENIGAVAAAGAQRVAVVRALTEADDPENAARTLRAALRAEVRLGAT
jgi:thiamine-phosphate pyrophosphorylase